MLALFNFLNILLYVEMRETTMHFEKSDISVSYIFLGISFTMIMYSNP